MSFVLERNIGLRKINRGLISIGLCFCILLPVLSPSILEAMEMHEKTNVSALENSQEINDSEEIDRITSSEETTTQVMTTEEAITAEIPETGTVDISTEQEEDQNIVSDIDEITPTMPLEDIKNSRGNADAAIVISNASSLAQTGLGFSVEGTMPNRILTFNGAAAGKSYRIIQTGTSLIDGIAVNVPAGSQIELWIDNINIVRPAINTLSNADGTAFGVQSGHCIINMEENTVNTLQTSATGINAANLTALTVAPNAALTIKGNGELRAYSGKNADYPSQSAAGIGGNITGVGDITIESGTITASGQYGGAGIGTGAPSAIVSGNIIINGGTIEAHGGKQGAGIGTAIGSSINDIVIKGGRISAAGGNEGAGIGTGAEGNVNNITIGKSENSNSALKIEASSGGNAPGIGSTEMGYCRNILIKKGNITSIGGSGAPGIGMMTGPEEGKIQIDGGIIQATGGLNGAGIGTGASNKLSQLQEIEINGGEITAIGGPNGVGIGWAPNDIADSKVGKISITGGDIKATADSNYGVGIGVGWHTGAAIRYLGAEVQITGGTIVALGTDAGIGSRYEHGVTNIVISGGDVTAIGGESTVSGVTTKGPGIGYLYQVSSHLDVSRLQLDEGASVKAFSQGRENNYGVSGTNSSAAIKVGSVEGSGYLMNCQIVDTAFNQVAHDVYINTDDSLYQGPLRDMMDSFYSFAYSTGGNEKTHFYQVIKDASNGDTRLGYLYEEHIMANGEDLSERKFKSQRGSREVKSLKVYFYPPSEKTLESDIDLVESGGVVSWTLHFKNASVTEVIEELLIVGDFEAGGMELIPSSIKINGQRVPPTMLNGSSGRVKIEPGEIIIYTFQTTVTGVINQKRTLRINIRQKLYDDVESISKSVYIKNKDATYPNEWAEGLGIWSVPKKLNFGYVDIKKIPTTASLDLGQYQPYTQNIGLYTRVYENGTSSSNGWQLKLSLGQFENEQNPTQTIGEGVRLEMNTSLKEVKKPNQNPEMLEDPLGNRPPTLINNQISLFPGAAPNTIIAAESGADMGTWDLIIPLNTIKLSVPFADPNMHGVYYHSKLVWSLEIGP